MPGDDRPTWWECPTHGLQKIEDETRSYYGKGRPQVVTYWLECGDKVSPKRGL